MRCKRNKYNKKKKLKERYTKIWREKINLVKQNPATNRNENKLRTYCKFKFIFQQEKYLDNIKELSNRSILARFRISAHKLEIERGRYTFQKLQLKIEYANNVTVRQLRMKNTY